jgi:type 1 glutamine amidotransferase
VGNDGQPAMTPAGKQALLDAIAGGKGFVALHSGSDTFHTGEGGGGNPSERRNRYTNHGDASDPYIRMLGGEFINHDQQQIAKARVVDPAFPGCGDLGEALDLKEEWYSLKDFAPDLHVLLVMETDGMEGPDYRRPPYPLAWARAYGQGRVWFNAMGHREDVWDNPKFQAMLVGGIEWAGGRAKADPKPNLAKESPGAMTLPAFRPGT